MEQPRETRHPLVTADHPIANLLAAPLEPDWTIDRLAEDLLRAIAEHSSGEDLEFVLDAMAITDRQSRRLLRPLLACVATKAAAEAGTSPNIYGGRFALQRPGPEGPIWILGDFENTAESVRVAFRRSATRPNVAVHELSTTPPWGFRAGPSEL